MGEIRGRMIYPTTIVCFKGKFCVGIEVASEGMEHLKPPEQQITCRICEDGAHECQRDWPVAKVAVKSKDVCSWN